MAVTAMQAREVTQNIARLQTVIVPTEKTLTWLDARLAMDSEGKRMPSNADYDRVPIGSDKWYELRGVFPALTDSVIVYPEKNGRFKAGKDVVDAYKGNAEPRWVFPASSIPKEALGRKGVGINIDHPVINIQGKAVILSSGPESTVTVLENFIQENGKAGEVDETTRVPLKADTSNLPPEQIRWLFRIDGAGVRPLVRDLYDSRFWRDIFAFCRQDIHYGVAQLETTGKAADPEIGTVNIQLAAMVRETLPSIITALEPIAKPEVIENLRHLQRMASE